MVTKKFEIMKELHTSSIKNTTNQAKKVTF